MAHPLCASPPAPVWVTLTDIALALRGRGITGDLLVTLVAVAPAEGQKHPDWAAGTRKLNARSIGDCAITSAKWGPSIGVLQVRSLNPGRAELASEPWRDQQQLLSGLDAQAAAVKAIHDARGLGQWSGYSSGAYRDHLPEARDIVANLGGTDVTPDQSEIGPTGPSPTGSIIIGGRLIQPADIRLSGEDVFADVTATRVSLDRNLDEADRLTITVSDPKRTLLRNPLLNTKTTVTLDGVVFEYTDLGKRGSELDLTFTDAAAVDLNRPAQQLVQEAGTATRGDFLRRILSLVPWVQADIEPGLTLLEGLEMDPEETPWQALGRFARQVEWRRCAVGNRVLIGSDAWLSGRAEPITVREWYGGVDEIDIQSNFGIPADQAVIYCHAGLWAAPPSTAVRLEGLGPGDGDWLVTRFARNDTTRTDATVTLTRPRPALDEPKPPPEAERSPVATGADIDGPDFDLPDTPSGLPSSEGAVSSRGYQWPLQGPVSSGFRTASRPNHQGIDIAVPVGTRMYAAKAGRVESVGLASGYGLLVVIRHEDVNGRRYQTYYAHCNSAQVRPGQIVDRGDQIAISGGAPGTANAGNSRGPHLHFEVRVNGTPQDPIGYLP